MLVAPVSSACAAWDVGRLRRAGVLRAPVVRPQPAVVVRAALPSLLLGVLGMVAAWLLTVPSAVGSPPGRDVLLLGTAFAVVVGAVSVGAVAGTFLPHGPAAAGCLVLGYFWFVYPPAIEPLWLRHLTGFESGCCVATVQAAPAGVLAPVVLALGITVACALLVGAPWFSVGQLWARRPATTALRLTAAVACVGIGTGVAVSLVDGFGDTPTVTRTTPTTCAGSAPRVCVWPKHASELPDLVTHARHFEAVLAGQGLAVPALATESVTDAPATEPGWVFGISDSTAPSGWLSQALVEGLVPTWTDQCDLTQTASDDVDAATTWLLPQVGEKPDPDSVDDAYRSLRREPAATQAAWVRDVIARTWRTCPASRGTSSTGSGTAS
jgi:hypothetical protein